MAFPDRIRTAITTAAESLSRATQSVAVGHAPSPGDLYVLDAGQEIGIEWLVVRRHPDDPKLILLAPVDDFPLAGTPDLILPDDGAGRSMTVRCGETDWFPETLCIAQLHVGTISGEGLALVARRLADLVHGRRLTSEVPESDFDPEYEDRMAEIARARVALLARPEPVIHESSQSEWTQAVVADRFAATAKSSRGKWLPAVVAVGLALSVIGLLLWSGSFPRKGHEPKNDELALAANWVGRDQRGAVRDVPEQKFRGDSVILEKDMKPIQFVARHHQAVERQTAIQIARKSWLVAQAGKDEDCQFLLQQRDTDWLPNKPTRKEFVVIVTSHEVLPGLPKTFERPTVLDGLLTEDEIATLQRVGMRADTESRDLEVERILQAAFDKKFGAGKYSFDVWMFSSENQ